MLQFLETHSQKKALKKFLELARPVWTIQKKWNVVYLKWIKHEKEELGCKVRKTSNNDIVACHLKAWLYESKWVFIATQRLQSECIIQW
jgi:hypothetical protein